MRLGSIQAKRCLRDERAAVLVEGAIVMMMITLILAGILNYGSLFGNSDDVAGATRSAALAASSTGLDNVNDSRILNTLISQSGSKRTDISRVVIYKATNSNGQPPAICTTMATYLVPTVGATNLCNVYTSTDFTKTDAQIDSSVNSQGWAPASRKAGTDYLGVWVQGTNKSIIDLVWTPDKYSDSFVIRLQPAAKQADTTPLANNNGFVNATVTSVPNMAAWGCWINSSGGHVYNSAYGDSNCWGDFSPSGGTPGGGDGGPSA